MDYFVQHYGNDIFNKQRNGLTIAINAVLFMDMKNGPYENVHTEHIFFSLSSHFDPEKMTKFTRLVRSVHYYDQFSYIFLTFEFFIKSKPHPFRRLFFSILINQRELGGN